MKNIYRKAFDLISRSAKESWLYLLACPVTSLLYILTSKAMGLPASYDPFSIMKISPIKGLIAFLPGVALTSWLAAGLVGRLTSDALKSDTKAMSHYANGWFLRKMIADSLFICVMWMPVLFFVIIPFASAVLALVWMVVAAWLGLRISLWLNASIAEDLGLIDAVQRSFNITPGHAPRILILAGIPTLIAFALSWSIHKLLPAQAALHFYLKSLLDGIAAVAMMGIFAAVYVELRSAKSTQSEAAIDEVNAIAN